MRTLTHDNCFFKVTLDRCYADTDAQDLFRRQRHMKIIMRQVAHKDRYADHDADTDARELFRR
jgi:hypothetical protein